MRVQFNSPCRVIRLPSSTEPICHVVGFFFFFRDVEHGLKFLRNFHRRVCFFSSVYFLLFIFFLFFFSFLARRRKSATSSGRWTAREGVAGWTVWRKAKRGPVGARLCTGGGATNERCVLWDCSRRRTPFDLKSWCSSSFTR